MTNIELPEDNRRSRLQRAPKADTIDDVATAMERVEAFWAKYPDGSILPEVEVSENADGYKVYTVRAFVRKNSASDGPDAVAHATRGENDEDDLVRAYPQESAETSAISRAIRNLGILATPTKATPATLTSPQTDVEIGSDLTLARERAELSQKDLAAAMTDRQVKWSQTTVSSIEKGTRSLRYNEAQHLAELIGFGGAR
jgi:DNA-binding XRE family transcriptional regulator